ncbi:MAG: transposase [Nitrospira sp.]|nr:transposase [Nitrospira sp.]
MKHHRATHTVYKTQYCIVWVMWYRRNILVRGRAESLRILLQEARSDHPDWHIEEIGIEGDPMLLHMVIPPKDAVASVVRASNRVTNAGVRATVPPFLRKVYWDSQGAGDEDVS